MDKGPSPFGPKILNPCLYPYHNLDQDLTTANFDRSLLSPSSIGFSPLTQGLGNACSQNPCRPPPLFTGTSPCPGLDHPVSNPVHMTRGTIHTMSLASCRHSLSLWMLPFKDYPRHINGLPSTLFNTDDTTLEVPYRTMAVRFQVLLTPYYGCFSTFPRSTGCAIGLTLYLRLEVDAPRIHAKYPIGATLDTVKILQTSSTGLSPSMVLLSRSI